MTALSEELRIKLGAFVDGELAKAEQGEVEALINSDPAIAAEVEALFALNDDVTTAFDHLLDAPVPEHLATLSKASPEPANSNRAPAWGLAAALAFGAFLGAGVTFGWLHNQAQAPTQVASARSWLGEVAEYHQVYARQTRHLVEVPASEKDHIEKWLGKEIGVNFNVPDLSPAGWDFQGARLLVAAGKPVAQLLYTDAQGQVIALCAVHNGAGDAASVSTRRFGDVNMATWKTENGSFAIVGEEATDLPALANLAGPLI